MMKAKTIHVADQHSISLNRATRSRILALDPADTTGGAVFELAH